LYWKQEQSDRARHTTNGENQEVEEAEDEEILERELSNERDKYDRDGTLL
jgi:hypothetical protein